MQSVIKKIIIKIIRLYQIFLSPYFGNQCRFTPTCSNYAIYQFEHKKLHIAFVKSIWRILRCNPFSKGGYDLD